MDLIAPRGTPPILLSLIVLVMSNDHLDPSRGYYYPLSYKLEEKLLQCHFATFRYIGCEYIRRLIIIIRVVRNEFAMLFPKLKFV